MSDTVPNKPLKKQASRQGGEGVSNTNASKKTTPAKRNVKAAGKTKTARDKRKEDIPYKVEPANWFTNKPYGFKFLNRNKKAMIFFLPISPSNLTITTNFATNIIPTLYGTVEEHSDIRYYDIVIDGTTGFAPRYTQQVGGDTDVAEISIRSEGRRKFPMADGVTAGGFFSQTVGAIKNVLNKVGDLVSLNARIPNKTAIFTNETGYVAFHNLYKFLLKYKKDASGADGGVSARFGHPLTFFNYKDNNEYDVSIRTFTLKRSAENPMLYNYQIIMRAYNLRTAGSSGSRVNLSDDELQQRLQNLGLKGVSASSILGTIKQKANNLKSIVGIAAGGKNILGR